MSKEERMKKYTRRVARHDGQQEIYVYGVIQEGTSDNRAAQAVGVVYGKFREVRRACLTNGHAYEALVGISHPRVYAGYDYR